MTSCTLTANLTSCMFTEQRWPIQPTSARNIRSPYWWLTGWLTSAITQSLNLFLAKTQCHLDTLWDEFVFNDKDQGMQNVMHCTYIIQPLYTFFFFKDRQLPTVLHVVLCVLFLIYCRIICLHLCLEMSNPAVYPWLNSLYISFIRHVVWINTYHNAALVP